MIITTAEVESLQEMFADGAGGDLPSVAVTGITLPAAVELACCEKLLGCSRGTNGLFQIFRGHLDGYDSVSACITGSERSVRSDIFKARNAEFFPVSNRLVGSNDFYLFRERFKAAVRAIGFSSPISYALTGALLEMVENVIHHSSPATPTAASGVVGYHVEDGRMSFAVGDAGCGVLASLRSNPAWSGLSDSAAALDAILKQCASRRIGLGEGEGFKQLFRSLTDLNGWLRFRSGDAMVQLQSDGAGRLETRGSVPWLSGFQLCVTCSRGTLAENEREWVLTNLT